MVSSDKRCGCGESIQLLFIHNNTPQLASGRVEAFSTIYLRRENRLNTPSAMKLGWSFGAVFTDFGPLCFGFGVDQFL